MADLLLEDFDPDFGPLGMASTRPEDWSYRIPGRPPQPL